MDFAFLTSGLRLFHLSIEKRKNDFLKVFVYDSIGVTFLVNTELSSEEKPR